jgi:hypothetical protein
LQSSQQTRSAACVSRSRQSWDEELLIKRIRGLREQRLPLYTSYVAKNQAGLFHKSLTHFGSWTAALRAAGVVKKVARVHSGGIEILRQLRDVIENSSTNEIPEGLKLQADYYFGSFPKAIAALKKDKRLAHAWSKSKVIQAFSRLPRSKLPYSIARRRVPKLVNAAERYFGSWGKALHAAGIDPNPCFVRRTSRTQVKTLDLDR